MSCMVRRARGAEVRPGDVPPASCTKSMRWSGQHRRQPRVLGEDPERLDPTRYGKDVGLEPLDQIGVGIAEAAEAEQHDVEIGGSAIGQATAAARVIACSEPPTRSGTSQHRLMPTLTPAPPGRRRR